MAREAQPVVDRDEPEPNPPQALGVTRDGIWALAWPTMVAMSTGTVVRFTDFAMVGALGPAALAGVGVGGQFAWLFESIGMIASAGLAAILARAVGAGNREEVDQSFRQAQILGFALMIACTALLLPFATEAIALYGVEPEVVNLGGDYLWWRAFGMLPLSGAMVFGAALRAAGDVWTPLWTSAVAAAVNVFLNWVLIFGNFGAPELGVVGAALATNLALTVMFGLFVALWLAHRLILLPGQGSWRPDWSMLVRLIKVGTPSGVEGGLFQIGLLVFQRIMSPFGTHVIAAYNIGATILSFSFIPGVGYSLAAGTLVGQHLGAKNPDRAAQAGWRSMWGAVGSMTFIGAVLILAGRPIARIFTDDESLVDLTLTVLVILGIAHPFMAIEFALAGALRGAGDTVFPMLTVFSGLLIVRLGLASALVAWFDAGITMIWTVLIADYVLKSIMFIARFRAGRWKRRTV